MERSTQLQGFSFGPRLSVNPEPWHLAQVCCASARHMLRFQSKEEGAATARRGLEVKPGMEMVISCTRGHRASVDPVGFDRTV